MCVDQGGGNLRAEKMLLAERGEADEWSHLMHFCEIHGVARSFDKTFNGLLSDDISALISYALSVRNASAMALYRESLQEVVQERIVYKLGLPPLSTKSFKQELLREYMDTSTDVAAKDLMLLTVLNGDWTNHSVVEFYLACYPGVLPADPKMRSSFISTTVAQSLASSLPKVWPRHRWLGAKKSVNDIMILGHIHGLLLPVYQRFVSKLSRGGSAPSVPASHESAHAVLPTGIEGESMLAGSASDGCVPVAVRPVLLHEDHLPHSDALLPFQDQQPQASSADFADLNKKWRDKSLAWLQTKPLAKMSVLRVAMQPLTSLLHHHLDVGSKEWEERQAMASCQEGTCGSVLTREYPLTMAAQGSMDQQFYKDLEQLFMEEDKWSLVPSASWDCNLRCLAFRLVARQGAALYQQVSFSHSTFPVRAFQLIKQPDLWQAFHRVPPCVLGPFCTDLFQKFNDDDDLTSLRIALALHAMLQSLSIYQVEAGHASIRRTLVMRGVQVRPSQFADASAMHIFQEARRCWRSWRPSSKTKIFQKVP